MKKIIISISIIVFNFFLFLLMLYFNKLEISSIELKGYNSLTNEITINVKKEKTLFDISYDCIATNDSNKIVNSSKSDECILTIPFGDDYLITLKDKLTGSKNYNLYDYIDSVIEFNFDSEIIYLAIGETKKINYAYIGKDDVNLNIENDEIISFENNVITGLSVGKTSIYEKKSNKSIEVIVTDLITDETISSNKQVVPCNRYTEEEAKLLDNILEYKINSVGYKTRAAAIEAARFLTLQFPYRIPYFYENGRVSKQAVHLADGEGRYYHKGLYLSDSKKESITYKVSGPAIWGCPLCNWEDDPDYGYYWGKLMQNGLDCSGFVSWVLYNAGFDPGDVGAGENKENPYQLTDTGYYTSLTQSLIDSNKIKSGDLFNYWGHIAIIVGIDDENFYVAESLQNFGGVSLKTYKKQLLIKHSHM